MDNGMESMLDMYLFETNSLLEQLDEILLNAEKMANFSEDDVQEIFRIMHTIKGSSAMMQFNPIMSIAHRIEDLFFIIRESGIKEEFHEKLFNLMFRSNDFLKEQIEKVQQNEPLIENIDNFTEEVSNLMDVMQGKANEPTIDEVKENSQDHSEEGSSSNNEGKFAITVFFDEESGMENLRSFMLVTAIKDLCENFDYVPKDIESNGETSEYIAEHGFLMTFNSQEDLDEAITIIKSSLNIKTYETHHVEEGANGADTSAQAENTLEEKDLTSQSAIGKEPVQPKQAAATPSEAAPSKSPAAASPTNSPATANKQSLISVNLTKLDTLMNIVGEIVITESMVTSCPEIQGFKLDNFTKSARQLRKLTDELQDIVMSIRMVPVSGVFQKMNRIVRDMSQSLGKNVKLTTIGADTEVDKTIVDSIGDPIMHMVRNSMDHGIEVSPADREAQGKDPQGEIMLMAQHTGSEVVITIKDDGRGVNVEKVLEKAKNNQLLTKPESEYTKKEILQLLLLPGFSTKDQVTEFSGRGVGMDVVKKNIEKVGGIVTISSEEGEGTCTTFKIPLTLAIVDGMEVAVGKSVFTIPIINIRQSFKISQDDIVYDADRGEMIRRMDNFYPIIRIHELYEIQDAATEVENGIIIWVEAGDKSYCLFVDELLGEQQVVVKPLPSYLNSFNIKDCGIAGCTILGDGNISIILDVLNLADASTTPL